LRISTLPERPTTSNYIERVNRAIDHVVSHLAEPLRLSELARLARLSPFHFHRVFQAMVGETPADFVKRLRLEKALTLMAHSRPPSLTAIALSCGFGSSSDFSRSFKQRFGVPPREFDLKKWRTIRGNELEAVVRRVQKLPPRTNPDHFRVRIRDLPSRTVAYIRVDRPYQGSGVFKASQRLMAWAERYDLADGQWLGYQWENPEITALEDCRYYVAIEAEHFKPKGEIGCYVFPPMTVAEIELHGDIALELRALYWLYGSWLPRSVCVPDDQPGFEAWIGRPFASGTSYFELNIQLPIRRG
jgi:AraC family transcriptional regulator